MQNMHSVVDSFFLQPIIETEVAHLLRNLDPSKSTGLHHIPIKYLKMATTVVAPWPTPWPTIQTAFQLTFVAFF